MTTLNKLKCALRESAIGHSPGTRRSLSDVEYRAGFNIMLQDPGWITYKDFIIPKLTEQVASLVQSRNTIDVLEIGPGSDTILGYLPLGLRRRSASATLQLLANTHDGGKIVAFHRQGSSHFDDLVCHKTSHTWDGFVGVSDKDDTLDTFALFIAGYRMQDEETDKAVRAEWRHVCRTMGHRDKGSPGLIQFYAPENKPTKSPRARRWRPAAILAPKTVEQVQICVKWALKHELSLNAIGGGHSDHSVWPGVVSLDLAAFNNVHALARGDRDAGSSYKTYPMVVAQGGCKTGDITREAMSAGLAVPLGSCPSVGAGLWLQGGLGHMSRDKGLSSDSIIGILMVSVKSGEIFHLGHVPEAYRPHFSIRPENHDDLFWAMKGAGSRFGIVLSVTFRAHPAPKYRIQRWYVRLHTFEDINEGDGFTKVDEAVTTEVGSSFYPILPVQRPEYAVQLFEIEKHMADLQKRQVLGKLSAFKRCVFLSKEKALRLAKYLVDAFLSRKTGISYIHILHCGGEVRSMPSSKTAFGCREWEYACVITGVWPREEDDTSVERAAKAWVYQTVYGLLPACNGVYSADLGPDPLDNRLAEKAFGPNMRRLTRLKATLDPHNVLPCGSTFRHESLRQQTIVMVTGDIGVGKDHCAGVWSSTLKRLSNCSLEVKIVSISEATKQEYAAVTGADPFRLNEDRDYKESHQQALTEFFHRQLQTRPQLQEEHFLKVVNDAQDADVLFITGIREEAPVTAYAHLLPDKKLLDIRIEGGGWTRQSIGGHR
ncbi:Adenine phosphoribosyltransferase [Penicillium herquei]|nr:Adenine phosphoribosyltransferase [Penicillium herquei]